MYALLGVYIAVLLAVVVPAFLGDVGFLILYSPASSVLNGVFLAVDQDIEVRPAENPVSLRLA